MTELAGKPFLPELINKTRSLIKRANSEYLYWDEFKYKPMPEGVAPEEAWCILKLSRMAQLESIALSDSNGRLFSYWQPDGVLRELHFIDQQAGGSMLVDYPAVHSDEKKRYIIRSLIDEAISSSQIEGAVTTRVIAKEMLRTGRQPRDNSEQMIYNNYKSMEMIKKHTDKPLTFELLYEIHSSMVNNTLEDPAWGGRFRTLADEEIQVLDSDGQTILHSPPTADRVPELMQKLCDFANNSSDEDSFINPVVKGIILHFWLAYVHPFMDGNGRTARALFYWYMLKHNYWLFEYLAISSSIMKKRIQYYKSFLYSEIDDNDLTYFIVYNLMAIHSSIEQLASYIDRKKVEKRQSIEFAKKYPSLNQRQRALIASSLEKRDQVFTIETHSRVHGTTYQTARTDLLALKELGLMKMHKQGRKFVFMPADDLVKKLETN